MTTAEKLLEMSQNKQKQKAKFWYRNMKKRHSPEHIEKLDSEIRSLRKVKNES